MSQDASGPANWTVKYQPVFCQRVVDYMGHGYSLTAFAGEIGVSRAKLDDWIGRHLPFAEAVARSRAARTRALEAGLLAAETGPRVSVHRLALKSAADEDGCNHGDKNRLHHALPPPSLELPDNGRD